MKIKRIISILLCIVCVFGINTYAASPAFYDIDESSFYADIQELYYLGIVKGYDDGNFLPEASITRAEFCQMVAGGVLKLEGTGSKTYFYDLLPEHWAHNVVGAMTASGYITGAKDGNFYPDEEITYQEVLTILIRILGYEHIAEASGGYPVGYEMTANQLGLTKGITKDASLYLTRGMVCKIINNTIDVPIIKLSGIQGENGIYIEDPDVNLLYEYHKIRRGEGVVSANEFAGLNRTKQSQEGTIVINNTVIKTSSDKDSFYLGHNVKYAYKIDVETGDNNLIYIEEFENEKLIVSHKDFQGYSNGSFKYYDEKEQLKTVKLSLLSDILYNGELVNYTDTLFDNVNYGTFTLIKSKNSSEYNTVIIEHFNDMVTVGMVDLENYIISDADQITKKLELNPDKKKIIIYDENGNIIDFDKVQRDAVVIAKTSNVLTEAYVKSGSLAGRIKIVEDDKILLSDDTIYTISSFAEDDIKLFSPGDFVSLKLDWFGNIATIKRNISEGNAVLYLLKAVPRIENGSDEVIYLKFYDMVSAMCSYTLAENVTINNSYQRDITYTTFCNLMKYTENGTEKYNQLVSVIFNNDMKITHIETAKDIDSYLSHEDGFTKTHAKAQREYIDNASFDFDVYVTTGTKILSLPNSFENVTEKDFKVLGLDNLVAFDDYTIEAFAMSKDAEEAAYLLLYESNLTDGVPATNPVSVVTKITESITDEGESVIRVYYLNKNGEGYVDSGKFDDLKYTKGSTDYYFSNLNVGDVISFTADDYNMAKAFMVYSTNFGQNTVYADNTSYGMAGRCAVRNVEKITSKFITLTGGQKLKYSDSTKFIIADSVNGKVRLGSASDIEIGKKVLIQIITRGTSVIIVYK